MAGSFRVSLQYTYLSPSTCKKKELGQYPAIFTLGLVNNPYLPTSSLYLAHVDSVKLPFFSYKGEKTFFNAHYLECSKQVYIHYPNIKRPL